MNEQTITRWARQQLSSQERRELFTWMVTCTDPDLPVLVQGILRHERETQADTALQALGREWSRLTEAWQRLLDGGSAGWVEPGPALSFASIDDEDEEWAHLDHHADGTLRAVTSLPWGTPVRAWLTSDDGDVRELMAEDDRGVVVFSLPISGAPRPTVWLVRSPPALPGTSAIQDLTVALGSQPKDICALRWTD